MLTSPACIRPGNSHIGNPALVYVQRRNEERTWGQLNYHRPILEIEQDRSVRCVRVEGETDMLGLCFERPENLVRHYADFDIAFENGNAGDRRIEEAIRLNGAIEICVIVSLPDGVGRWVSALEFVLRPL